MRETVTSVDRRGGIVHRSGMSPRIRLPALLLLSALLVACGSQPARQVSAAQANDVLFRALALVGTPYRYGGNTPAGGFDCSGLVGYVFRESAGLSLPRSTRELAGVRARTIERKHLTAGDLVFFGSRTPSHVGIYVGDGRFVHAPSSGGTVRMDRLDASYWKGAYLYARRVLD